MDFSGKGVALLSKLLDLTATSNKVLANNIANANTPGYKKYDVSFQRELVRAVESKDINKIKSVQEKITLSGDKSSRKDGNNVDLDKELIAFYQMSDRHNLYLELLSKKFKGMVAAIQGR
ncbi:MAG: flagellar basal body rod protein FlgB [Candidatus Scalindua sp.]